MRPMLVMPHELYRAALGVSNIAIFARLADGELTVATAIAPRVHVQLARRDFAWQNEGHFGAPRKTHQRASLGLEFGGTTAGVGGRRGRGVRAPAAPNATLRTSGTRRTRCET